MNRSIASIAILVLSLIALTGIAPTASADDGTTVCTASGGDPPQQGLCVSTSNDDCMVWYVNDLWHQCIVEPIDAQ